MMFLLKWFLVPIIVLAVAGVLAGTRFFDNGWVVAGYAVVAFLVLRFWQRAAYRLVSPYRSLDWKNLDESLNRQIMHRTYLTFGLSISTHISVILCLAFVPAIQSTSGFVMAFAVLLWTFFVSIGVCNVLTHQALQGSSPKVDVT